MTEKDQVFWDAIMDPSVSEKKKFRLKFRLKKYHKGIDAAHLAELFAVDKKEVEKVYQLFTRIDDDGSGSLTAPEIAQGLSSFGCEVSPKVVQAVMRASDKNGDGEINFEEFLAVVISKAKLKRYKESMFNVMKRLEERSGEYLTPEDLQFAWSEGIGHNITSHEAKALLAQADISNEGFVTLEHFSRMWQNV